MCFLHDGTGWALYWLSHEELAWLILEPDTGLDHCLRILLSCFRARTSAVQCARRELIEHNVRISHSFTLFSERFRPGKWPKSTEDDDFHAECLNHLLFKLTNNEPMVCHFCGTVICGCSDTFPTGLNCSRTLTSEN